MTSAARPIRNYFAYCRALLLEPTQFFREEFNRISLNSALTFGLISAWLSTLFLFFYDSIASLTIQRIFVNWLDDMIEYADLDINQATRTKEILFHAGLAVIYPVLAMIQLYMLAGMIYLFARIFIQDQTNLNFKNCLKILAFSMVSAWLSLVPIFGELIAYIVFMILIIIGLRETFWVTTRRAALVVFTPQVLFFSTLLLAVGAVTLFALLWASAILYSV